MRIFRRAEKRDQSFSISDPALAEWFGVSPSLAGVNVSEQTALGISAVWRSVSIVSGTIASLPLKTYRTTGDERERVASFLDNPAGPESYTPFEWTELVLTHLLLHGNAFLMHLYNRGGAIIGLEPLHPSLVSVERDASVPGGKVFTVRTQATTIRLTSVDLTHIPGLSSDGLRGLSPLSLARQSFGTAIAADRSAARMFGNGPLVAGMVTPTEDLTEEEAIAIKEGLNRKMLGQENAGTIAVINRKLNFTPWTFSAEDSQFIESRAFQITEIARWFGIPKALLAEDGASTWGSGIAELVKGMGRFTFIHWTQRIEERLSTLLPAPRFVEFDYTGMERPTPEEEIRLLIEQVNNGLISVNEARRIRNLPTVEGGDVLRQAPGSPPPPADEPVPEVTE